MKQNAVDRKNKRVKREAEQRRLDREKTMWLCRVYDCRGAADSEPVWAEFKRFCEVNNFTDHPAPGRRTDNKNPWRILFNLD